MHVKASNSRTKITNFFIDLVFEPMVAKASVWRERRSAQ
jgi:hypothetical protein